MLALICLTTTVTTTQQRFEPAVTHLQPDWSMGYRVEPPWGNGWHPFHVAVFVLSYKWCHIRLTLT